MPHRVDTTMNEVQGAAAKSCFDRASADSQLSKLAAPHNPMLSLGERRERRIHPLRPVLTVI